MTKFFKKGTAVTEDKKIWLNLVENCGEVDIVAMDERGDRWQVGTFMLDGHLQLHGQIPNNIGLSVDDTGTLKTVRWFQNYD